MAFFGGLLVGQLLGRFMGGLIYVLIGFLTSQFVGQSFVCLIIQKIGRLSSRLIGQSIGWSISLLIGGNRKVNWSVNSLVNWFG